MQVKICPNFDNFAFQEIVLKVNRESNLAKCKDVGHGGASIKGMKSLDQKHYRKLKIFMHFFTQFKPFEVLL